MSHHANIIVRPLITEKSSDQAEARNTYSFVVAPDANKTEIKAAVESLYSVKVKGVRTLTRKDKPKRTKNFRQTMVGGYKRAIVTLDKDSKIELF
jgi:large subunit ribosomal protein L23